MIRILPLLFAALFVAFFVSQILVPLLRGRALFPMFRKQRAAIEKEISELNSQIDEADLVKQRDQLKAKLERSNPSKE